MSSLHPNRIPCDSAFYEYSALSEQRMLASATATFRLRLHEFPNRFVFTSRDCYDFPALREIVLRHRDADKFLAAEERVLDHVALLAVSQDLAVTTRNFEAIDISTATAAKYNGRCTGYTSLIITRA